MTSGKPLKRGGGTASSSRTPEALVQKWEREFRSAFADDGGSQLTILLKRFDLGLDEAEMLEGTIEFVKATAALSNLDGLPLDRFLASQRYDPSASDATYSLVFDVASCGTARLLVAPDLRSVDLADLFEQPWERHRMAGYSRFWVTRIDGASMSLPELDQLDVVITDDLTFDCEANEMMIVFDPDSYDGALAVSVDETSEY